MTQYGTYQEHKLFPLSLNAGIVSPRSSRTCIEAISLRLRKNNFFCLALLCFAYRLLYLTIIDHYSIHHHQHHKSSISPGTLLVSSSLSSVKICRSHPLYLYHIYVILYVTHSFSPLPSLLRSMRTPIECRFLILSIYLVHFDNFQVFPFFLALLIKFKACVKSNVLHCMASVATWHLRSTGHLSVPTSSHFKHQVHPRDVT